MQDLKDKENSSNKPDLKGKDTFQKRRPNLEVFQSVSKDGKYQIIKTVVTDIVPINYIRTVLLNSEKETEVSQ